MSIFAAKFLLMDNKVKAWIFLFFTMLFWGMSFVWTRQLLAFFSPVTIVLMRLVISSILLTLFSLMIKKLQKVKKADIKWFVLLSFFQPFLYFLCEGYGVKYTSASFSAIMIATIPLFTPIGARIVYGERLSIMNFMGLIISFAGVGVIVVNKDVVQGFSMIGVVILLGAVLSAVGYMLVLKNVAGKYNSFSVATYQNIVGILFFLPPFLLFDGFKTFQGITFGIHIIFPIMALAILASSIAFVFNTFGVRELGPSKAAAFTNSVPVFTVIFAFLILDEPIGYVRLLGMTLVISGLFLAQQNRKFKHEVSH